MIIGHQHILNFLRRSVEEDKIAHAYLFTGPDNVGKRTVANEFIKMLGRESDSLDVLKIEPEIIEDEEAKKEKEITISQARQIQRQLSLSSHDGSYKIVLISQAEKMRREAANALLKTLEEPLGRAVLVLLADNYSLLLPTIISRCQVVKFFPVSTEEIKKFLGVKYKIEDERYRSFHGRPGLAVQYIENPEIIKDQAKILSDLQRLIQLDLNERYQYVEYLTKDIRQTRQALGQWLIYFRDLFLSASGCENLMIFNFASNRYSLNQLKSIIGSIRKTDGLLANPSINHRLALEGLMLEL